MTTFVPALLIFLFPLAYSPGPGNIFFAAIGARSGLVASLPALASYHVATWIVTMAIGLGFFEILLRLPGLFMAVKYSGMAYILWLAWVFYRTGATETGAQDEPAGFQTGAVLLLLNPKAYLIIVLMFAQFPSPDLADPLPAVLAIATIFTLNNLIAFTVWTVAGDLMASLFAGGRSARLINTGLAASLAGVAVWMLLG